jgi:hypothetical protein
LFRRIAKAMDEFRFKLQSSLVSADLQGRDASQAAFKWTLDLLPLTMPPVQLDTLVAFYCDETTIKMYSESFCSGIRQLGRLPTSGATIRVIVKRVQRTEAYAWIIYLLFAQYLFRTSSGCRIVYIMDGAAWGDVSSHFGMGLKRPL